MDLLSTVRKSGSRGGVNFSWDDVANSAHRENYLGHSLKAPVGRWAKGRDLNWYAKAESSAANAGETEEEKEARERREEIRRIKEAEEDAINRALGLPITPRNTSGANAIEVQGSKIPERTEEGSAEQPTTTLAPKEAQAGESRRERHRDSERHHKRRHRSRSRERGHGRDRERDQERHPVVVTGDVMGRRTEEGENTVLVEEAKALSVVHNVMIGREMRIGIGAETVEDITTTEGAVIVLVGAGAGIGKQGMTDDEDYYYVEFSLA
ncbi:hypothetical protein N0V85_005467 [Neurospora sp. IMI 360204]|nr:hypothetical protein N0V85_005467 [Neurospora sp. IMI 360204]